mmetsp:Transcript_30236/g.66490  ORF Transcript_30236/g.66490 Transcript_30236/m.66490 type:complete len:552 (-) Transcript_30236:1235-2890(-)
MASTMASNGGTPAKPIGTTSSYSSLGSDTGGSAVQAITTEGWLELFLTLSQKRTFSKWREDVADKSLTHRATRTSFDRLATYIPESVAPNVVTAAGFMCLGQSWYLINKYGEDYPTACTWFAVANILLFFVANSVDLKHADRIRQRTALGDLFKYCCDCCSTVFLAVLTTYCLGGTDTVTQWYAVQLSQLVLFTKHLSAFHRNAGLRYNVLTGPGEVILSAVTLLAFRATLGLDWLCALYEGTVHKVVNALTSNYNVSIRDDHMDIITDSEAMGFEMLRLGYYIMFYTAIVKVLLLSKPHGWSRFGLSTSLMMRFLPAVFLHMGIQAFELKTADVICDGLFMAVLTSDITLAKMAGREIHPWVVLMSMFAVMSHLTILALVIIYYIAIFGDLCSYLNMPLMTVCRNVYCDGVYDLCHIGHKTLFKNALAYGNRLFVGVVGDEDASNYKRPPIMTAAERCAEVEACKSVTKVIPNSPCFGLTKEFLDEHQIHVVAFGEEYLERWPNPDDDIYYGYPRKIGIARPLPRTKGLSTSDLIKRIQEARPAGERNDS